MDYEKKLSIGDYVQGQRTYTGEIIKGEFNGFHLVDKIEPSSVVGVIYVENDRCYDVIAKSVVLIKEGGEE